MKDIQQHELDNAPRVGDHVILRGAAYHEYVIHTDDGGNPLRTILLMCGIHTDCKAWE